MKAMKTKEAEGKHTLREMEGKRKREREREGKRERGRERDVEGERERERETEGGRDVAHHHCVHDDQKTLLTCRL